jgi:hypothetical protein
VSAAERYDETLPERATVQGAPGGLGVWPVGAVPMRPARAGDTIEVPDGRRVLLTEDPTPWLNGLTRSHGGWRHVGTVVA